MAVTIMQLIILRFVLGLALVAEGKTMNEIRTYMSFTYPVDPVKIQTIPDMDMSYALASTLVKWSSDKQLSAGLADKWEIVGPNTYRFTLRQSARWSDGKAVTCGEVAHSFERGLKAHPTDLRSLSQMVEKIVCASDREVDFVLKVAAHGSGLVQKLTEPNYCVLKINSVGAPKLSVTTGPFFLSGESITELTLTRNSQWFGYDPGSPERVVIRRTPQNVDLESVLLNDPWPNLIEASSLISQDLLQSYKQGKFEIWQRPLDKVFLLQLGKRIANNDGKTLLRLIKQNTSINDFVSGLSGFSPTDQIFPRGYQLYDPQFSRPTSADLKIPERFRERPLDIVISPTRVSTALKKNIRHAILQATGVEPNFISIPLEEVRQYKVRGDFDLYAGTVGLADPDPEGAMSFYLEGAAPAISSVGNDYLARLDSTRKEEDRGKRISQMRSILSDAVCAGYLLPIFHLSTIGIGRPDLDFSQIPQSEESVTLSKIRFRSAK